MSAELESFRASVEKLREGLIKARHDESEAYENLRKAKERTQSIETAYRSRAEYLNQWEGEESDCAHTYQSEPSGRGMGFDSVCTKCGHFQNAFPVY